MTNLTQTNGFIANSWWNGSNAFNANIPNFEAIYFGKIIAALSSPVWHAPDTDQSANSFQMHVTISFDLMINLGMELFSSRRWELNWPK